MSDIGCRPINRGWRLAALACVALAAASCGDRAQLPVGPAAGDGSVVGWLQQSGGLLSCAPLSPDSVTQVVGPAGGTIVVGPHVLSIPAGALSDSVSITAVAPADSVRRVYFEPEGLTFATPAQLQLSYAGCDEFGLNIPKDIAYTTDLLAILEYLPSVDNPTSETVRGRLNHFSNYAVAW